MPQHISLTLSAVLLSATVISSPSQASILPPTPSEHRDLLGTISLAQIDGRGASPLKLPQLAPISLPLTDGPTTSVASVCFITDAGDCGSLDWEGEGELDNAEKCRNEGYVDTPCGAGLIPIGTCPYDSNWHSQCGCPSDYDKTCTGADEQGKGEACEGKYKECCNLCTGYDYTEDNIPSGYVQTDSCESCDGTKYKARCDISEGGYMDCGEVVGVGGSCTDDSGTYYKQCSCPLNYEWNEETKTCACATSFKYDCQGSGYATTQTGNTCDDKYSSCDCAEGFVWDGESGMCVCDGVDWCALNQDCGALGYAQQTCPKWSIKCPYDTSFVKCIDCPPSFSEECKGTGEVGEGQSCEGKYQSCTCDSSYQYTCTGTGESGSGEACNGKYTKCTCTSPYTWSNGACTCPSTYQYTCSGTGYSGGSGSACGGKYTKCTCKSPYTWTSGACKCPSTYKYTCSGTGYSGGSGTACGGKYTKCTCKSGYTWKNGACQKQTQNGAVGELYYCNGKVVGVRATGMGFYVAMKDLGRMTWSDAYSQCRTYSFCGNVKGTLPTKDQLVTLNNNQSRVNSLLSTNGGTKMTNDWYWSSTDNSYYGYYIVNMSSGDVLTYPKYDDDYVRPVLVSW